MADEVKGKSVSATDEVSDLRALIKIMAEREARLAQAEAAALEKVAKVQAQRASNASSEFENVRDRQSICTHLKGGKHRMNTAARDYCVYFHRFIDGTEIIKCRICSMKWYQKDTQEVLIRHGREIPNHTGIGWREAVEMTKNSTDKPSSSEMPFSIGAALIEKKQGKVSSEPIKYEM